MEMREQLQQFRQRVSTRLGVVAYRTRNVHGPAGHFEIAESLREATDPAVHCRSCGLPWTKHVPHEPTDPAKPNPGAQPKEWATYLRAMAALYQAGVKALTTEELLAMPLPVAKHRLSSILAEVAHRLVEVRETSSRWAKIANDDWL